MDRRKFLKTLGIAGAAAALPWRFDLRRGFQGAEALAFAQSDPLKKFIPYASVPLPQVLVSDGTIAFAGPPAKIATHYPISVRQFSQQLHPNLANPTKLWGYADANHLAGQNHLGGIIIAQKGTPVVLTVTNNLPATPIIPADGTIMASATQTVAQLPLNRIVTHLHGGFTPWISDGGPFGWNTPALPTFLTGQSYVSVPGVPVAAGQQTYYYTNDQGGRLMWYHDHAMGLTRTNAYSGIASGYLLRDPVFEANLVAAGLPDFIENGGAREIPIIIQDKIFVSTTTLLTDPTWATVMPGSQVGDLWYAHVYDPKRYKLAGSKAGKSAPPDPSCVPEFFGDTMLANGVVYPDVPVEARRYRFRILNANQARFLNLQLYVDNGSADSITLNPVTLAPTNTPYNPLTGTGLAPFSCMQIGTEGGFLPNPVNVPLNVPFNPLTMTGSLLIAPAERADIILDFSGYSGQKLVLYNDAPAPFPMGDPRNDYFPGAPKNPVITTPGFGPNTRQIMRFSVGPAIGTPDPPLAITTATNLTTGNDPLLAPVVTAPAVPTVPIPTRILTLNETFDAFGRLLQMLGTNVPLKNVGGGFGRAYTDPATETPNVGAQEVWQIVNLTADTHPIHFHLVNVQVIARQPFNVSNYNGGAPTFTGPARPPEPNEAGWKETVRMNPGEVTTVIMKFNLPIVPFAVPSSSRFTPNTGKTVANEYVWHCHILEHEEHDMMRPLIVSS